MKSPESNAPLPMALAGKDFADSKVLEKLRAELRAEEWAMHRELMAAARLVLKNFYENPHKSTPADLARLLELSSRLGRLATESEEKLQTPDESALVLVQFEAALKRVYARRIADGKPVPAAAVVDVESSAAKADPQP